MARLAGPGLVLGLVLALTAAACGADADRSPSPESAPAAGATTTAAAEVPDLTLVNLNILHGTFCPRESDRCGAEDRVDLFFSRLDAACPDLVALQEVDALMLEAIRAKAPGLCDGSYEVVWHGTGGVDRELVLARVPVLDHELTMLPGGLRSAFWVRTESPLGVVDLVVTHLASIDNVDCTADRCPPPCEPAEPMRVCQARHVLDFLEARRAGDSTAIVAGDLNDVPASATLTLFADAGLSDSHLAAGNPECDRSSGSNCTAGREDGDLSDLTDPGSQPTQRIDYVLVDPAPGCDPAWDPGGDADGDGIATGLFVPEPGEPTGSSGVVFPSDHTAVAIDLAC